MSEYPIPEDLTATQKLRRRAVTHEEGAASIQRLINSHFKNDNGAQCSIPARADDDDIVASDYAKECRERIAKQDAEIERLNKMRTHCENCGADYMATGIEAGCSCKLAAENASLKAQVERLEKANIKLRGILTSISAVFATIESCTFVNQRLTASEVLEPLQAQLIEVLIAGRAGKETQ